MGTGLDGPMSLGNIEENDLFESMMYFNYS